MGTLPGCKINCVDKCRENAVCSSALTACSTCQGQVLPPGVSCTCNAASFYEKIRRPIFQRDVTVSRFVSCWTACESDGNSVSQETAPSSLPIEASRTRGVSHGADLMNPF